MSEVKYNKYEIYYDGKLMEKISSMSKKSLREYIKDHYDSHIVNVEGVYREVRYKLGLFSINLIK